MDDAIKLEEFALPEIPGNRTRRNTENNITLMWLNKKANEFKLCLQKYDRIVIGIPIGISNGFSNLCRIHPKIETVVEGKQA